MATHTSQSVDVLSRYSNSYFMMLASLLEATQAYDKLMDDIGLTRSFRELGIATQDDLETIITNGFNPQRVNNNPRKLTKTALARIMLELLGGQQT